MANDVTSNSLGSQSAVSSMGPTPDQWEKEADANADGSVTKEEMQAALVRTSNSLDRIASLLEDQQQYFAQRLGEMPPSWTVFGMGTTPTDWDKEADATMSADGQPTKEEYQAALDQTNDSLERIAQGTYYTHNVQEWKDQHTARLQEQKKYYEQQVSPSPVAPPPVESEEELAPSTIPPTPPPEQSSPPDHDTLLAAVLIYNDIQLAIESIGNGSGGIGVSDLEKIISGDYDEALTVELRNKYPNLSNMPEEDYAAAIQGKLDVFKQACTIFVDKPDQFSLIEAVAPIFEFFSIPSPLTAKETDSSSQATTVTQPSGEESPPSQIPPKPPSEQSSTVADSTLYSADAVSENIELAISVAGDASGGIGADGLKMIGDGEFDPALKESLRNKYPNLSGLPEDQYDAAIDKKLEQFKWSCKTLAALHPDQFSLIDTALTGPGQGNGSLEAEELLQFLAGYEEQVAQVRKKNPRDDTLNTQNTNSSSQVAPPPDASVEAPADKTVVAADIIARNVGLMSVVGDGSGSIGADDLKRISDGEFDELLEQSLRTTYSKPHAMSDDDYDKKISKILTDFKWACYFLANNPAQFTLIDTATSDTGQEKGSLGANEFNEFLQLNKDQVESTSHFPRVVSIGVQDADITSELYKPMVDAARVISKDFDLAHGKDPAGEKAGGYLLGKPELKSIAEGKYDDTLREDFKKRYPGETDKQTQTRLDNFKNACKTLIDDAKSFIIIDSVNTNNESDEKLGLGDFKKIIEIHDAQNAAKSSSAAPAPEANAG